MLPVEACWCPICRLSHHSLLKRFRNLSTTSPSSSIKIGFSTGIPYSRTWKVTKLIGFNIHKIQFFISVCNHCNTNLFRRQGQSAAQWDSLFVECLFCGAAILENGPWTLQTISSSWAQNRLHQRLPYIKMDYWFLITIQWLSAHLWKFEMLFIWKCHAPFFYSYLPAYARMSVWMCWDIKKNKIINYAHENNNSQWGHADGENCINACRLMYI